MLHTHQLPRSKFIIKNFCWIHANERFNERIGNEIWMLTALIEWNNKKTAAFCPLQSFWRSEQDNFEKKAASLNFLQFLSEVERNCEVSSEVEQI